MRLMSLMSGVRHDEDVDVDDDDDDDEVNILKH